MIGEFINTESKKGIKITLLKIDRAIERNQILDTLVDSPKLYDKLRNDIDENYRKKILSLNSTKEKENE